MRDQQTRCLDKPVIRLVIRLGVCLSFPGPGGLLCPSLAHPAPHTPRPTRPPRTEHSRPFMKGPPQKTPDNDDNNDNQRDARDTLDSKVRYATPGIAMLAMTDNHINTKSMGVQCPVQCCYEQNAQSQTAALSLHKCVTKHPILHSGPQKGAVPKNPVNSS